mgnify:CR=1 FL=1
MSIWSEIKYALNSTLGTKHFESLDSMLISNYTLVPSSYILKEFVKEGEYASVYYETPYQVSFTPNYNGNITFGITSPSANDNNKFRIKVFENGEQIISIEKETSDSIIAFNIAVMKDTNYIVELRTTGATRYQVNSIRIQGTTIGGRVLAQSGVV